MQVIDTYLLSVFYASKPPTGSIVNMSKKQQRLHRDTVNATWKVLMAR